MPMDNPADLFLYELSGMYDAEHRSNELVGEILGRTEQSPLAQVLRAQQQQGQQKIRNLDTCFAMMEAEPEDVPCHTMDGMRAEFQAFAGRSPSMEAIAHLPCCAYACPRLLCGLALSGDFWMASDHSRTAS